MLLFNRRSNRFNIAGFDIFPFTQELSAHDPPLTINKLLHPYLFMFSYHPKTEKREGKV